MKKNYDVTSARILDKKRIEAEKVSSGKGSKKSKSQKTERKIKHTTIQTLPYERVISEYVLLLKSGVKIGKQTANLYSKTYLVPDVNYSSATTA